MLTRAGRAQQEGSNYICYEPCSALQPESTAVATVILTALTPYSVDNVIVMPSLTWGSTKIETNL